MARFSRKLVVEEVEGEMAVEELGSPAASSYEGEGTGGDTPGRISEWVASWSTPGFWDRIGTWSLYAVVFLTPLFFLPFTEDAIAVNKIALVSLLAGLALVSFLISVIERREFQYPFSLLSLSVIVFVSIAALSTLFSRAPLTSLWDSLRHPDSFLTILVCGLLFFLSFYFWRREDVPKIGLLFFAATLISALFGLAQIFGKYLLPFAFTKTAGFTTVGSLFGWGIMLATALAMIVAVPFDRLAFRVKAILIFLAAVLTFALMVLNFQVIWIALAVLFVILAAERYEAAERFRFPLAAAVVALALAFVATHVNLVSIPVTDIRPASRTTFDIAKNTLWGPRALLGSGPSTFNQQFTLYRPQNLNQTAFWTLQFYEGHDFILSILVTMGILGLCAALFIVGAFARQLVMAERDPYIEALGAGCLFLLIAWFIYPAFLTGLVFAFIALGLFTALASERRIFAFAGRSRRTVSGVFLGVIVLLALSLAGLYLVGQKYVAAVFYGRSLDAFAAGNITTSLTAMSTTLSLDPSSDEYLRTASQMLITQVAQSVRAANGTVNDATRLGVQQTLSTAVAATQVNGADPANWVNLGGAYEALIPLASGADSLAEQAYRTAFKLDPQNPQAAVNIARVLMTEASGQQRSDQEKQAKLAEAQSLLDTAIALKDDYAPAHFLLAQFALNKNDQEKAVQNIEKIKATNPGDPALAYQLGLFYYQNQLFAEAQKEFERAVSVSPNYADARYFLGLTYDREGLKSQAIDQFEAIQKLDPKNASQLEGILTNLRAGRSAFQNAATPGTATSTKK